ncbi:C2 domain-containing protein [Cardamine amara subsp. amara]|uniref:C2 domain-containing protein n=1 Tax=Cardamine amara subsp. amara TaxID=228776 RepID=A0ABD1C2E0_CARAN
MESSLIHHIIIVLLLLWFISSLNRSHGIFYFLALIYLYLVHERYVMRLKRKLQRGSKLIREGFYLILNLCGGEDMAYMCGTDCISKDFGSNHTLVLGKV